MAMRANVYVDGFNLYYRCLRGTPYKWLDLAKLATLLVPSCTVNRIRYFTAHVSNDPSDPRQSQRQQTYLRALGTIPNLTIHRGLFTQQIKKRRLAAAPHTLVEIIHMEEKGSDVNLATHLLLDGFQGDFDLALVVSNDSDLRTPVQVVRQTLSLPVTVAIPGNRRRIRRSSLAPADFYTRVTESKLSASQFPTVIQDANGQIRKPSSW
jgi:hypothetical protein